MAYNLKYWYDFKDNSDSLFRVQIYQDSFTGTSYEITGSENPFVVSYPSFSSKFEPVRGSGCQINILSRTDRQFLDLYSSNMIEYQVKFYKWNGSTWDLIWIGYLDSEIYEENFSEYDNYNVSVSGNDGLALLDRFKYLDGSDNKYSGITSQHEVLQRILSKINLPFNNIYIYIGTSISGLTNASNETTLNNTYVNDDNFYDEDGEPESCRSVLESILLPYGAFIIQNNGSLYITDIHSITDILRGITFRRYSSSLSYIDNQVIYTLIDDIGNLKMASSDSTLNVIGGKNSAIVKYSPYKITDVIDFKADAEDEFTLKGSTYQYGTFPYLWWEDQYSSSKSFNIYGVGTCMKLRAWKDNILNTDYYLKIQNNGSYSYRNNKNFTYKLYIPKIIGTSNYSLKITMDGYFRKSEDFQNPDFQATDVKFVHQYIGLQVGDKKYVYSTDNYLFQWEDLTSTNECFITFEDRPNGTSSLDETLIAFEDKWIGSGVYYWSIQKTPYINNFIVPLSGVCGDMIFDIYGYVPYKDINTTTTCLDARLKNIRFTIVDSLGNEIKHKDVEYVGHMDKSYKDKNEIKLKLGTNYNSYPIERGGLIGYSGSTYYFINSWLKNDLYDNIENLLLRSYVGNYNGKSLKISCKTNMVSSVLGYLTYNTYLSGKKFMIVEAELNYSDKTSELTLEEIFEDSLTINKYF